MRRLFTFFAILNLFAATLSAQVLFSTEFQTKEDFNAWTVVDANADGKTWTYDEYGDPSRVFYTYHDTNAAEDWMISPAIYSPENGVAAVSFSVQGSSYVEKLQLFYGTTPTPDAMLQPVSEVITLLNNVTSHLYLVNINAGEPLYLGFKACSDANAWRLYM